MTAFQTQLSEKEISDLSFLVMAVNAWYRGDGRHDLRQTLTAFGHHLPLIVASPSAALDNQEPPFGSASPSGSSGK